MNKKEYNKSWKTSTIKKMEDTLNKIKSMDDDKKEQLVLNINKRYFNEFNDEMNFWMSIMDYSNHIRYINELETKQIDFITNNNKFIKFHKLLKKRINNLNVLSIKEFFKKVKKSDKK